MGGQRFVIVIEIEIAVSAAVAKEQDHKVLRRRAQQRERIVAGNAHRCALGRDDLLRQGAAGGQAVDAVRAGVISRAVCVAGQRLRTGRIGDRVQQLGACAGGGVQGVQDNIAGITVKAQVNKLVADCREGVEAVRQILRQCGGRNTAVSQADLHKIHGVAVGDKIQLIPLKYSCDGVDALLYRVILYNGFGSVRCLQNQPGILPVIGDKRLLTVRRNEDPRDHRIAHVKRCRFRCPIGSVSAGAAGVVFDAVLPHLAGVQNNRSVRQLRRVRDERLTAKVNAALDPAAHLGIGGVCSGQAGSGVLPGAACQTQNKCRA